MSLDLKLVYKFLVRETSRDVRSSGVPLLIYQSWSNVCLDLKNQVAMMFDG